MKKIVGIGLGIGIMVIVLLVAFSNIDDLVSEDIEETASQMSEQIEEKTGEIRFENPLQTYEIDGDCEIAYTVQYNLEHNKGIPFKADQEYSENVLKPEFEQKTEELWEKYYEKMRNDPEFMKEKYLELFAWMEQRTIDHIMDYNSIHPKLRNSVELISTYDSNPPETHQEKINLLNIMHLIELDPYKEDTDCGKKFHEEFGDITFSTLKSLRGEESAQKQYDDIKKTIYG